MDHEKLHRTMHSHEDWDFQTACEWGAITSDSMKRSQHLHWLKSNDPVVNKIYRTLQEMDIPRGQQDKAAVIHLARMVYHATHSDNVSS